VAVNAFLMATRNVVERVGIVPIQLCRDAAVGLTLPANTRGHPFTPQQPWLSINNEFRPVFT